MNPQNPTLSLCMIVKDEENFLEQCLESVKNVVDEMIIVDTGSTDRTVEIARKYTDKVYFHPWEGSFSKARNYSIGYATCDWILQMDADEELKEDDIPLVREVIKTKDYNAISVALMNDTPVGWSKHYFQRLYRRGKARYEGIVHNQLVFEGSEMKTEIVIYHWGYNLSNEQMNKKFDRTETLLEKQLKKDNTNPFVYMNYLRIIKSRKDYKRVIREGEKALKICKKRMTPPTKQMITYDLVCALTEENQLERAETMARDILRTYPQNLDMYYGLGHTLVKQKRYEEAVEVYEKFLEVQLAQQENPQDTQLIIDTYSLKDRIHAIIADCWFELGQFEKGKNAARKAMALNPKVAMYKITYARNAVKIGDAQQAVELLKHIENNEILEESVFVKYVALCSKYPELGSRSDAARRGLERFPDSVQLMNLYAGVILPEEIQKAEQLWERVMAFEPDHLGARIGLCRIALVKQDTGRLTALKSDILEHANNPQIFKELAEAGMKTGQFLFAIDMYMKYLELKPDDLNGLLQCSIGYAKTGNFQSAVQGFKEVLRREPGNKEALQYMAAIRNKLTEKN